VYVPTHFALTPEQTASALAAGGFAHLVTPVEGGVVSTPLPLLYDPARHALLGHVARPNDHWQAVPTGDSLAIVTGLDAYVSPSFYASKAEHGRVVPTWNYEVLHVHGVLTVHDDVEWLRGLVTRLTDVHEARREAPWAVTDAPPAYIDGQLRAIVGVELAITRVEGKAKLSQNRSAADQAGVVDGLDGSAVAARMRAR
jgi:transcriptional regulator